MRPNDALPPYRFDGYLEERARADWYGDDPFLQRLVRRHAGDAFAPVDEAARALSTRASGPWRALADATALPELRPRLLEIARQLGLRVDAEARRLEVEATAAMRSQGLQVVPADPAAWGPVLEKSWPALRGKAVPAAFFDQVVAARDACRSGAAGPAH